ncbi:glycosyltransferase [Clostridium perfringens]|nr:glycosyltransferase [Clostridium perfringens]EHK2442955.1 glycosyltransferase [Clostridium perfringens]
MHILIIPSWYSLDESKTSGSFFREQAIALKKSGHKVTIIYPEVLTLREYKKLKYNKKEKFNYINDLGINTYSLTTYKVPRSRIVGYNYKFKKSMMKLYEIVIKKHGKPDIIHAHSMIWAGYNSMKLSKVTQIPLVITEHSSILSDNILTKYEKSLVKKGLNYANQVITVSNSLKDDLSPYINKNRIKVIPNVVNSNLFNRKGNKYIKEHNECFRFITISYLRKIKRVDLIIKAFAQKFRNEKFELFIGGDGIIIDDLKELCNKLKIENQVTFLGNLSREDVKNYIDNSDVFVLSSDYETFGVVLIEALACGKPVISTMCGGPNDIVNYKNGILVPKNNQEELSNAMESIFKNYKKYVSNNIIEDCYNRFSEEVFIEEINKIYMKVLKS